MPPLPCPVFDGGYSKGGHMLGTRGQLVWDYRCKGEPACRSADADCWNWQVSAHICNMLQGYVRLCKTG